MYPGTPGSPAFGIALVACTLITYLVCGIPFGFVLGELLGKGDIRKSGSGNIGTTNALRVGGKKLGALTLLCDVMKGVLCVAASHAVLSMFCDPALLGPGQDADWVLALICATALAGHMFTPYLHFKGGKGIAVGFGVCIAWIWPVGLSLWIPFLIGVILTRYVSVGSMLAAASLPFWVWFYYPTSSVAMKVIFTIMALFVIWAHRSNIAKLAHGNESKLSFKRKKGE